MCTSEGGVSALVPVGKGVFRCLFTLQNEMVNTLCRFFATCYVAQKELARCKLVPRPRWSSQPAHATSTFL
ncbi:hypothetical protein GN244_ATG00497 [Phytophthora infestans]|uniref:Uncharacterized protein n=1 Tax=Phytophthora infestans TaxID=4787 RepID=A0A833TC87_PHYIN|nr:hypothetical protein GN244_ATG00497 [Phytophthora infestans]